MTVHVVLDNENEMFKKLWNPVIYLSKSMSFIVGRLESLIAFVYW